MLRDDTTTVKVCMARINAQVLEGRGRECDLDLTVMSGHCAAQDSTVQAGVVA